jgi:glycosyltransferase involved in cell wall biosynthesis
VAADDTQRGTVGGVRISVCIPTVRPGSLGDAVRSIVRQTHHDWELIVVGQGNDEARLTAAVTAAAQGDPRVRYVHHDCTGLSRARNRALRECDGEAIAFTDDDCEADPNWLAEIDAAFERQPRAGLVAGSMLRPADRARRVAVCPNWEAPELLYVPEAPPTEAPAGWGAAGGDIALRRATVEAVGEFDEQLGAGATYAAAEDIDYMLRAELLGIPMYATPRVVVHHTHGYRYGLLAVYRQGRNYARGNGALAAKFTLAGDDRGDKWRRHEIREATWAPVRRLRLRELPVRLLRLAHFLVAYRSCLRHCRIEPATGPADLARRTLQRV